MPTAIVTGAHHGIGAAVTKQLLDRGWEVLAHYRRTPGEEKEAIWWQANFSRGRGEFEQLPNRSRLHAIIHCAGAVRYSPCEELFADDWQEHLDAHLIGPAQLTNQCLPALKAAGGHVVYVNSISTLNKTPAPGFSAYRASKAAATAWLDSLRVEAPEIRVTNVLCDKVDTPSRRKLLTEHAEVFDAEEYIPASSIARAIMRILESQNDMQPGEVHLQRYLSP